MNLRIDRRDFLRTTAIGAAALAVAPYARAVDLNGKLRVAAIGTGNRGKLDLLAIAASPHAEVVALCDVDHSLEHFGWAVEAYPKAAQYSDFRRLFERPEAFDAVMVSTPDHMHAPIAMPAMELGKHVFCQKPLTHTVNESRDMRAAAERYRVVTQMGNQIQSHPAYRMAVRMLQDGVIGKVKEVHAWQSGPLNWMLTDDRPAGEDPVPKQLHWDLWLGVAPHRPYKANIYHPINWRAWQDFGSGQLGDFGCHILDPVFMGLELGAPTSIEAAAPRINAEVWTRWSRVSYQFPGTSRTAGESLPLTWYDGEGRKPKRKGLGLPREYELPRSGSVLVGEAGTMVIPHWAEPALFPEEKFRDFTRPVIEEADHFTSWVDACVGDGKTTSNFGYAGPLTEAVLLGVIAIQFPKEQLQWDGRQGQFTHHADANEHLSSVYRSGW
jgi:predicted dehydrogenase